MDWRYVPVRRAVLFIEASLAAGLQWAVFERNDDALWMAVRRDVELFLDRLWRGGALAGASADEAYAVQCGRGVTMTDDDVAAGRLRLTVLVALTHPAEFIVLTLEMPTAGP
jgi:phage tail sheath protein FI